MDIANIRNMPGMASQSQVNLPSASYLKEPTYIPCEFCEVPILSDELVLHQVR